MLEKIRIMKKLGRQDPDGILRDPNIGEIIPWKPGEPRKGIVDFGHNSGSSYKEIFEKYKHVK